MTPAPAAPSPAVAGLKGCCPRCGKVHKLYVQVCNRCGYDMYLPDPDEVRHPT